MKMRFLQALVYTRKFIRTQKKESLIAIIIGVIISALVVWITGEDMFTNYESTKTGFFTLVSACIWIGIFNSIQLICREKKDIVKDELDKRLHATSYIAAHFIFQFFLCFIQAIIIMAISWFTIDFNANGVIFVHSIVEYFVTIFLLIYAADALALIISAIVPTSIVAMTVMPLVLILQLVMSGVLFELSEASEIVANITISKWGMAAMGCIGFLNDTDNLPSKILEKNPTLPLPEREIEAIYEHTAGHLLSVWLILIGFIVISYILASLSLKATTKRLSK